jgi:hypothetical protein
MSRLNKPFGAACGSPLECSARTTEAAVSSDGLARSVLDRCRLAAQQPPNPTRH